MTPEERKAFVADVAAAITSSAPVMSDEERRWVQMAMKRQAQSLEFRQAIITHTFKGLVWAAVIALFILFKEWAMAHGFKP